PAPWDRTLLQISGENSGPTSGAFSASMRRRKSAKSKKRSRVKYRARLLHPKIQAAAEGSPLFSQIDMLNIFDRSIQETLSQPLKFFHRICGEEFQGSLAMLFAL